MGNLGDFAGGLVEEVLGDMAKSFFGSRKRMDDLIDQFVNLAHELRGTQEGVVRLGSELMGLLPGFGAKEMASLLGLGTDSMLVLPPVSHTLLPQLEKIPWGLTLGSRYAKIVLKQYDLYQQAVDAYMNGATSPHPDQPKKLVVSLHYTQLLAFTEHINESIGKINADMPASCVIRYATGFVDPGLAAKERITGAHCPYPVDSSGSTDLDKQYAYHTIDFDTYGLAAYAELPGARDVEPAMRRLCSELMRTKKTAIVETMAALKRSL